MNKLYADPFKVHEVIKDMPKNKAQMVLDFAHQSIESVKNNRLPENLWSMAMDLDIENELESIINAYHLTKEEFDEKMIQFKAVHNIR